MNFKFDPKEGLRVVEAGLFGPAGLGVIRLALDTGATSSLINAAMLEAMGYDASSVKERIQVTTGSGVEYVPRLAVRKLTALGLSRKNMKVLCHTLPPSATVDGLLGLDFFRNRLLKINFKTGVLDVQ